MPSDSHDKLIEIGVIGRAHGVCGEMRIFLHNENSDILNASPTSLLLRQEGRLASCEIERVRHGGKHYVVALVGVHTRAEAEKLNGAHLLVLRANLPKPEPDEFYIQDILGLEAMDNDVLLGKVTSSRAQGEIEVITVRGTDFEMEVPLVHEYVTDIDFVSGRILLKGTDRLLRTKITGRRKGPKRV